MAFDGLVLYTLAEEMRNSMINARVDKIYQPDNDLLTMTVRGRGKNLNLVISANPQYARVHFTEDKFTNPPHPPAFCMLLRKYLTGGRIVEINQPGFERILELSIQNINEVGNVVQYKLIAELMGRHSNLILLSENGVILDGIKRIPSGISRHREVLPGRPYVTPPEQDKANPLMAEASAFKALLQIEPSEKLFKAIMTNYRGISPLIAREIAKRANLDPNSKIQELGAEQIDQVWIAFEELFTALRTGDTSPTLIENSSGKVIAFSCFKLTRSENEEVKFHSFETMSGLLDFYYGKRIKKEQLDQFSGDLRKMIRNLLEKDEKKYDKLINQLDEAENSEDYRIKGEMLKANLHLIEKGSSEITVTNYYDPEMKEMTISLDPSLSPQANAQKYFKRYNKLRNSIDYVERELEKLDPEIDYLRNVELSLEQIESKADVEEIREELIQEGYLREKRKSTPNRHQNQSKPMKFKSSDGFDILVGRNNRQNDKLTKGIAARDDLWFHVKDIPGSHVVIRNHDRQEIPDLTIEEAAILAVYYSKAKESKNVSVDYTQIKHVNKQKGAKPGLVYYENYQTVIVNPDEQLVAKLRLGDE